MALLDSGEPFGLPKGTVRGIVALAFAGTIIQQVIIGSIDPITFIAVAGPFLGFYAGTRPTEAPASAPVVDDAPLAAPVVGGDEPAA